MNFLRECKFREFYFIIYPNRSFNHPYASANDPLVLATAPIRQFIFFWTVTCYYEDCRLLHIRLVCERYIKNDWNVIFPSSSLDFLQNVLYAPDRNIMHQRTLMFISRLLNKNKLDDVTDFAFSRKNVFSVSVWGKAPLYSRCKRKQNSISKRVQAMTKK